MGGRDDMTEFEGELSAEVGGTEVGEEFGEAINVTFPRDQNALKYFHFYFTKLTILKSPVLSQGKKNSRQSKTFQIGNQPQNTDQVFPQRNAQISSTINLTRMAQFRRMRLRRSKQKSIYPQLLRRKFADTPV